jgi:glutaredoxin 3
MKHLKFYHDGCDICVSVGQEIVNLIGLLNLDVIHVGINPSKVIEANNLGVKSFPALVNINGNVLHFNVEEHEGSTDCLL